MGRTILDSRSERAALARAKAARRTGPGAGSGGRGGGGRDPSGLSRLATLLRVLVVLIAVAVVGGAGLVAYAALGGLPSLASLGVGNFDAPVSDDSTIQTFVVRPGQSAADIGKELSDRKLIRSPLMFRALVEARDVGAKIEAGEYQVSPSMTTSEIVAVLSRGAVRTGIQLTIPEGWRAEQVAQKVESLGIARADELLSLVQSGGGIQLAEPLPAGRSLEGYLFPNTYEIKKEADARFVVELMTREFDRQFSSQLRAKVAARGLTVHQAVTLASIVEREAARPAEQPLIAGVYLNRLKQSIPLQADPTVQFAVATANLAEALGFGYWKRDLTADDLRFPSPYNTYVQGGLPPGPICSPGLGALEAVANPTESEYLFFVAKGDGSHVFAKTDTEHAANVERYQRGRE